MNRRLFTKYVIGISLSIMTGAYNIENPVRKDMKRTGHTKGKEMIFYIDGKPIAKAVPCELPISSEVKRITLNNDVVSAK